VESYSVLFFSVFVEAPFPFSSILQAVEVIPFRFVSAPALVELQNNPDSALSFGYW